MTGRPAPDQRIVHGCMLDVRPTMHRHTGARVTHVTGQLAPEARSGESWPSLQLAWQQTGSDGMDGRIGSVVSSGRSCDAEPDALPTKQTDRTAKGQQWCQLRWMDGSTAGRPVARREVSSGRQPAARQCTREMGAFGSSEQSSCPNCPW